MYFKRVKNGVQIISNTYVRPQKCLPMHCGLWIEFLLKIFLHACRSKCVIKFVCIVQMHRNKVKIKNEVYRIYSQFTRIHKAIKT